MDKHTTELPATLEETLKKAIALEDEGYRYYVEAAQKVNNSLGKRMLERLARDEEIHKKRFTELYNAVSDNKVEEMVIEDHEPTSFEEIFNRLREQLDNAIEEMGKKGVDDEEVIEMAMDLETTTRLFYEKAAKRSDDAKVSKLFTLLGQEEKAHQDILRKTLNFLEDPSLFFGMAGSPFK